MFIRYIPSNAITNVFYLIDDETGIDWYEYQKTIDNENIKIAVDESNNIRFVFTNPALIFPEDCIIVEPMNIPNDLLEYHGGWFYINGEFEHITNTESYKIKVEKQNLEKTKSEFNELKLQYDLGILSKEQESRFNELKNVLIEKYQKK